MKTKKLTTALLLAIVASLASCVPVTPYYPPGPGNNQPGPFPGNNNLYQRVVINGKVYYKRNGNYYKRVNGSYNYYKRVNGTYVRTHPYSNNLGYQRVVVRGKVYYKRNNKFYKRVGNSYTPVINPYLHR